MGEKGGAVGLASSAGGSTGVRDAVLSRCARIALVTAGSSMMATIFIGPPQRAQVSMSTLNMPSGATLKPHGTMGLG